MVVTRDLFNVTYTSLLGHGVCLSIVLSESLSDPSNSLPTPSVMTPAVTVFIYTQGHHLPMPLSNLYIIFMDRMKCPDLGAGSIPIGCPN